MRQYLALAGHQRGGGFIATRFKAKDDRHWALFSSPLGD
jgi:hypothetical protein